ncbi:pre-16S rRNA-processing nuclease YqgF [Anaerovibrio sp.]|uniref:pre-16S rRNA-processing nuclease YqgF n=1 Tax=Anaerovibrio sp. TaxID=1872532 RepID=UPI003F150253
MKGPVAGLDPGRDKCGLAVVDAGGSCLLHQVVPAAELERHLKELYSGYGFRVLVMGNGTTSKKAALRVRAALPDVELVVADEYRTTDAAREEYWRIHPPSGWRRLVPRGMLVPPEPVDDLAALILARRYVLQ